MVTRTFNLFFMALAVLAPAVVGAEASYPSRPVKLIVPFAAGGSADLLARVLANSLSKELGGAVVVENRTGASGNIGMEAVAKSAPDGHTLLYATSNLTSNPAQMRVPYDVQKDFAPIAKVITMPLILIKSSQVAATTVPELVATLRQHPGKFNYSSSGAGGVNNLAGELFKIITKTDIAHVPYNGAGPAINDVAAGQIELTFSTYSSARALLGSDKIAVMAVAAQDRLSVLPHVPTFREAGISGMDISVMNGILAPARTPEDILKRLYGAIQRSVDTAEFKHEAGQQGTQITLEDPATFAKFLRADVQWWTELMARSAIPRQ